MEHILSKKNPDIYSAIQCCITIEALQMSDQQILSIILFPYIFGNIIWVLHTKHEFVFEISVYLMIFKKSEITHFTI